LSVYLSFRYEKAYIKMANRMTESKLPMSDAPTDAPTDTSTENDLSIRPARPDDMATVMAIDARITGEEKLAYWSEMFERFGRRDDRYFLLAETDRRVVGYVVGEVRAWEFGSPPCGWVFAVGVDPSMRTRKIGTRLFQALCDALQARGIDIIRTMTARDDELNMAFFRSQGMMGGPFIELEMPLAERQNWQGERGGDGT
jgi:ribosomal protein S18 acetylase RimI-like enzyme